MLLISLSYVLEKQMVAVLVQDEFVLDLYIGKMCVRKVVSRISELRLSKI